jgi:ribonuclease HI
MPARMPWVEAMLRGQKVFARAKADGSFDAEGGRVEIRYKANDGRAYRAAAANLVRIDGAKVLPDDACGEAEPVAAKQSNAPTTSASVSKRATPNASWVAYTDGACSGNPGPAGAGMVVYVPGGKKIEGYEYLGRATNNIAELTAVLRALEAIPESAAGDIVVHTDSSYSIGVLTKNWKPKVNQELIAKAKELVRARRARLVYVPGHAGVPDNELADQLAREAISRRANKPLAL